MSLSPFLIFLVICITFPVWLICHMGLGLPWVLFEVVPQYDPNHLLQASIMSKHLAKTERKRYLFMLPFGGFHVRTYLKKET